MKALILAAGRGSRMHALTEKTPKCLLPLFERTLLEWQLEALKFAGIEQILAVTGFQREKILPFFKSHFHNEKWACTNMAYSLLQADSILTTQEVLISYSDIVFHPSIIKLLISSQSSIAITYDVWWKKLWESRFANPLDDAESFKCKGNKLTEIGQKAQSMEQIEGQYMGLIKVQPSSWKMMKELITPTISLTELLNQILRRNGTIQALPVKGKWCEVDRVEDLNLYEKKLLGPLKWSHDFRWIGSEIS